MSKRHCRPAISLLAAQRQVNKGIRLRKQYIGALLKAVKKIYNLDIKTHNDLGRVCTLYVMSHFIMNLLMILIISLVS